jgi:leucyl/phenylalanyl-tRNA--protein transferase
MRFPDPRQSDERGLLCIGGNLTAETLREAYAHGIFPWPQPGFPLLWFSPPERGILDFADLHVPRSLQKYRRQHAYTLTLNTAFDQVIDECAQVPRPTQSGTWILPEMILAFRQFHKLGYAHSIECWDKGELVGGLYGVLVQNVFSGESMFYKRENASKLCVLEMVDRLAACGLTWMDIQMVTPVLESMGGKYISREDYLRRLEQAHLSPERSL